MSSAQKSPATAQIERFTRAIEGRVISRQSSGYDLVRHALVWNGRPPERYPFLIIEALSIADVVASVEFARHNSLSVSVRGTGHSYSSIFLCDGGLLLDLSRLNDVAVDRTSRRLNAGPGATSGQINEALVREGLAFPIGHDASVGIGGFLLGGGLGINSAAWGGMSTFNIAGADIVTADGAQRQINAEEHADLFWALKGGGPGLPFIATRFHLRCYDHPGAITSNTYVLRFSDLPRLAQSLGMIAPALDRRLQVMLAAVAAPAGLAETCTAEDHGRIAVLTAIAFADDAGAAQTMQSQLASLPILSNALVRTEDHATTFAEILEQGKTLLVAKRFRTDNVLCDDLGGAVDIIMRHLPAAPSPASLSLIVWRGQHVQPDAAYSVSGQYFVSTYTQWDLAQDDSANATWLRHLYDDMAGIATGAYVNEFDLEGRLNEAGRCYSTAAFDRLRTLRRQHDPHGVFHNPFAHLYQ